MNFGQCFVILDGWSFDSLQLKDVRGAVLVVDNRVHLTLLKVTR